MCCEGPVVFLFPLKLCYNCYASRVNMANDVVYRNVFGIDEQLLIDREKCYDR